MRVAVTASGPTLDSQVDPRFGRCAWFVVVDPDTMAFEAVENASVAAAQGAGIATAQMIAGKGVEVVLTGNCGPNAYQALAAAGLQVVSGVSGTVREAVGAYASGKLQASEQPNVASHYGMGASSGRGMGRGMGGGMAGDMGGSMGVGPGSGSAPVSPAPVPSAAQGNAGMTELLLELKNQLDALREQVSDINRRIDELHKDE